MGNNENNYSTPVVTDWDKMKECIFATNHWVSNSDVSIKTNYEKGDFLRIWCEYNKSWCSAENGPDGCHIYEDYKNQ